ncbi:hypothetical protein [Micromonospora sp. NPDC047730]|uniref:hypothetical protein n=1 Tax=Micromonospora sp. NPDC047730 TaxID=3364253 RepID=UPI0037148338
MKGFPLLREAAWLYRGNDADPSALLRLWERREAGGWDVVLVDPLGHDELRQAAHLDAEDDARAAMAKVYAQGDAEGRWDVRRHGRPVGFD